MLVLLVMLLLQLNYYLKAHAPSPPFLSLFLASPSLQGEAKKIIDREGKTKGRSGRGKKNRQRGRDQRGCGGVKKKKKKNFCIYKHLVGLLLTE
jgi:hypothetical protein